MNSWELQLQKITLIEKLLGFDGSLEIGQENIAVTKRMLLNPDEILRLNYKQEIVIIRGKQPCILDKFIYTKHPLAHNLQEAQISEYKKVTNAIDQTPIKTEAEQIEETTTNNDWSNF